jgi:hypothetical protein
MKQDIYHWYMSNRQLVDYVINTIFVDLANNVYIPKSVSYTFMFDWDNMFNEMVEYLYKNK